MTVVRASERRQGPTDPNRPAGHRYEVLTAPLPESMERELVIVDDYSTDGTFDILQRLAQGLP